MSSSIYFICWTVLCSILFVNSAKHLERFSHPEIEHYGQLHFDPQNYKLLVGARDYILTLGLESFDSKAKQLFNLPANDHLVMMCKMKGTPEELCHNFITAILPIPSRGQHSSKVLVCGTNAFKPECETRSLLTLDQPEDSVVSVNSYSPTWNTTSLIASNGQFFYAGPLDFRGIDSSISRQNIRPKDASSNERRIVRSVQHDSKWLNVDSNFVGSFEHKHHVYFLFRESAIEYMSVGERVFSRLGRVCKNDVGLKNEWTSFLKSRLSCSMGSKYPFYFDEIQSIHWIDNKLYAIFNTPANSIHGSAICSFTDKKIEDSFNGPFKVQRSADKVWESVQDKHDVFECKLNDSALYPDSADHGQNYRMNSVYQLMDQPIHASESMPLVVSKKDHFKLIAVDLIRTQHHETIEVMFVVTSDGKLLKYVRWPTLSEPCLVDELQLTESADDEVLTMKLLKDTQSLYFGTKKQVIRLQLHQCAQHKTRDRCLASGDPYCGWNESKMKCTKAPGDNHRDSTWYQLKEPVCTNQRWSQWAECSLPSESNAIGAEKQSCQCRKRPCANSERCLDGIEIEVANCTQHGQWTEWSSWSACSVGCGRGYQERVRTCSNPPPKNGGNKCEGLEREIRPCENLPFCRWSEWTPWSNCTCGGAEVRQRTRLCRDFANNLVDKSYCSGQDTETAFCDCKLQQSRWTEWFIAEVNGHEIIEERTELGLTNEPETSGAKHENRVKSMSYSSSCDGFIYPIKHRHYVIKECKHLEGANSRVWSDWSPWTECVNGTQRRARACLAPNKNCFGNFEEARLCNMFQHQSISENEIRYSSISSTGWSGVSVFFLLLFVIVVTSLLTGAIVLTLSRKRLRESDQNDLSGSHEKLGNFGLIRPYPNSEPNTYEEPEKYRILSPVHAPPQHYSQHPVSPHHHTSQMNMSTLTRHSSTLKKQTSFKAKLDDCHYN